MFSNPVDIQLPQVPANTGDPSLQRELEILYNSIHLLHAALVGGSGGTPGIGDVVSTTAASLANGVVVFADTGGKHITRNDSSGIPKLTTGVLGIAVPGVGNDYLAGNTQHNDLQGIDAGDINHLTDAQKLGLTSGAETALHGHKWPTISDVIDAGETVTIPVNRQLIICAELTNSGTIINDGRLCLI
jgi:hypothetical protein